MKKFCKLLLFFCWMFNCSLAQTSGGQTNGQLALQYASTGECDKAIVYFSKYYQDEPINAYASYLKCLISLKQYDDAEKLIKKHIKKFNTDPSFKMDLANLYELNGELDQSKKTYNEIISELPADINRIINTGNAFNQKQLFDYAGLTYQQGRKLLKGAYPFSFEMAEAYAQAGKFELMVSEYIDALGYNSSMLSGVQTVLQSKIINDQTGTIADLVRQGLLRKIQKFPQEPIYSECLLWLFIQEKDFESAIIQAKALDKRLEEDGARLLSLGRMAANNMEFETATACFQYVVDKGAMNVNYISAKTELINTQYARITKTNSYNATDIQKLQVDFESALNEMGKSVNTSSLMRSYAHFKAFYLHDATGAIDLLLEILDLPNIKPYFKSECKLDLGDIYLFDGQVWEAALIYGQVDKDFKNDALGREAKYRNARLSYFMGEFDWAKDQLLVLKQATSQLISNDALSLGLLISDNTNLDTSYDALLMYARADLLDFQNKDSLALQVFDSLLTDFPNHTLTDEVLLRKARIYKSFSDTIYVIKNYDEIITKHAEDIYADDAMFELAEYYNFVLKDTENAKKYYELLMEKFPGSLYVVDARKKFRMLRGDKL